VTALERHAPHASLLNPTGVPFTLVAADPMALRAIAIDADARSAPALPSVAVAQSSPVARRSATAIQYATAKRAVDVLVALTLLLLLLPLFIVIALAIAWESGFPILYRGERVGRHGRTFRVAKFRSMRAGCDQTAHAVFVRSLMQGATSCPVYKVPNDLRVTRVGAFLRRTSLDELPQLWNVLRGDMSLVGPRPDVPYAVAEYADWTHARLNVRPGITGLWQVSGRSRLSLLEMYRLDVAYAGKESLRADLSILLRTVPVVLGRDGAA
jgi:lipopolysaccharide/colanic/teichoic acid biosynthesis glycosyltransferase